MYLLSKYDFYDSAIEKPCFLQKGLVVLLFILLVTGCWNGAGRRVIPPDISRKMIDFLHDGKTGHQEVLSNLGKPDEMYEDGRIWVYKPLDMQLLCQNVIDDRYKRSILVLIFREDGILDRHSIVVLHGL